MRQRRSVLDELELRELARREQRSCESFPDQRNALRIKPHGLSGHRVDETRIEAADQDARLHGCRSERALALARDDAVNDREVAALRFGSHPPFLVREEQDPVQVEDGPPEGVVPLPAAVNHLRGCPESRGPRHERVASLQREAAELVLHSLPEWLRTVELVAARRWVARAEMRQPVLLIGQTDRTLERERHARLLVGLHLGEVDDDVRLQHGHRQRILVALAGVVRPRRLVVASMEAQPGCRRRIGAGKEAVTRQIDYAVTLRIAGQPSTHQQAQVP